MDKASSYIFLGSDSWLLTSKSPFSGLIKTTFFGRGCLFKLLLKLRTFQDKSLDPCYHLAIEEYLLHHLKPKTCLLYLWQSEKAVVIGRNQNPWKECRPALLEKENAKLVRRTSGGGTVYHDKGNLNFTFVVDRDFYDRDRQLGVILRALREFGIDASVNNRYDLVVNGKKCSGSSYRFRKKIALHHGTILLKVNKENLWRYLQPSLSSVCGQSTVSVRSEVINLTEVVSFINVNDLIEVIKKAFQHQYQTESMKIDLTSDLDDKEVLKGFLRNFTEWEWHYGRTPSFKIVCRIYIGDKPLELTFHVNKGKIENVTAEPFLHFDYYVKELSDVLVGSRFRQLDIQEKIRNGNSNIFDPVLVNPLMKWVEENHI